jgi:hypothetical protein
MLQLIEKKSYKHYVRKKIITTGLSLPIAFGTSSDRVSQPVRGFQSAVSSTIISHGFN